MKNSLSILLFFCFPFIVKSQIIDVSSGLDHKVTETSTNLHENTIQLRDFDPDCESDFWTINEIGEIQQWSLIDGIVSGGDIILNGGRSSIAYCGDDLAPTFYSGNWPENSIMKYNLNNNEWDFIPIDIPVLNNAGHRGDQFFMETVNGVNKNMHYFDGQNSTQIDSLPEGEVYSVYDTAVDTLGNAWAFVGNGVEVSRLNKYDSQGLVSTFPIEFASSGTYGSFFLNNKLYIGQSNKLLPILITGNTATVEASIPFPDGAYYDMASCQTKSIVISNTATIKHEIQVFPNPNNGVFNIKNTSSIISMELLTMNSKMIQQLTPENTIDISSFPNGIYLLKIYTNEGIQLEKIIKQ